ncbi:HEPN domain-containing protein [Salinimicrobium sp. TH3]|uniref:HEPN domain-containing protein n=1 Tax=Salinimicrobium sp. TH3 TaxID=2997342 RepID=UPI002276561B|nr:HEPN domain-containing protein [Salinimicrobium sp. TH3]MCY2687581.1 HEPN domain-containing protein [Salinimicrobium sp. TH3]
MKFPEFDIVNIGSEDFRVFQEKTGLQDFIDTEHPDFIKKERFAIINKDHTKKFGSKKIYDLYNFLLLMFPSNLAVEYILDFNIKEEKTIFKTSTSFEPRDEQDENFLIFNELKTEEINKFIINYYTSYLDIGYLKSSIQNFVSSFDNPYYHFSYISFCISLESVVNGNSELLYRIRRNLAIICGKDEKTSQTIYRNLNKIYSLRSKIVHGSPFSDDKVYEYINYLQSIVSKMIIELIIHKIPKLDDLNYKLTSLGFGDRNKISENWTETQINDNIESVIYEELQ